MSAATDLMSSYAAFHRDRRNIATHFVGIPLIVFAVGGLLARPSVELGGWPLTPAAVAWALASSPSHPSNRARSHSRATAASAFFCFG